MAVDRKFYYMNEIRDFYYQSPDAMNGVKVRVYWDVGSYDPKHAVFSQGWIQGFPIACNALYNGKAFYGKDISCKASVRRDVERAVKQYLAESQVQVGDLIKEGYSIDVKTKYGDFVMQCEGIPGVGQFQFHAFSYAPGREFNMCISRDIKSRDAILALVEPAASTLFKVSPDAL